LSIDLTRTLEQCEHTWGELAIVNEPTLALQLTRTLVPARMLDTEQTGALRQTLPRLWGQEGELPQVDVKDKIAEGGMGVIRRAVQVPLQREVAVKEVRPERGNDQTWAELTREALLVGSLDHPNIVPVYMLGEDDGGAPVVVMKRIEGRSWGSILREPGEGWLAASDRDPLERHVEILMQVCNAVHFAHDRGILHRDLKPDNVMIGAFGEVYLLDWGIAVALPRAEGQSLPFATAMRGVAGTPGYMAPEMTTGDAGALTERTDVYLLGAILHEVVTGELRHRGDTMFQVLYAAYESKPAAYGPEIPAEIAAIARKATARDPAERYGSADDLRRVLEGFVQHRESRRLSSGAAQSALKLGGAIAEGRPLEVYRLFGETRFGFLAALQIWSGNEAAQVGLRDCLLTMVRHEIAQEDAKAARILLAEISDPPPELEDRVRELEDSLRENADDLARLRAAADDMDLAVGRRHRARLALYLAFDWTAVPLLVRFVTSERTRTWASSKPWIPAWLQPELNVHWFAGIAVPFLLFGFAYVCWKRGVYFVNRANRLLLYSVGICIGSLVVLYLISLFWPFEFDGFVIITTLVFGVVAACDALFIESRMWKVAVAYVVCLLGAAAFPQWNLEFLAGGNLFAFCYLRHIWSDRSADVTESP